MTDVTLVVCTAPEGEVSDLVDKLLAEQLIACVNMMGPMTSRYRWEGAIEESREVLLLMKTRSDLAPELRRRIVELHSYSVPEVLEFSAASGLAAYMDWVGETCK